MASVRHFLKVDHLNAEEIHKLLDLSVRMKADRKLHNGDLQGQCLGMLFYKVSTRTRVSFEVAAVQLGMAPIYMPRSEVQLSRGEAIEDTARVLSRYVDCVVMRTFEQQHLEMLAEYSTIPIINALTDRAHPCQALADIMTMREHFGDLKGRRIAFIGAANNVSNSLLRIGPMVGVDVSVICPELFGCDPFWFDYCADLAKKFGTRVETTTEVSAVEGADVIYTDAWASMGQERESEIRRRILEKYQVNDALMERAGSKAIFLHCLPAHRGEEVTSEVMDGPSSRVFEQAENRLHTEKALLLMLLASHIQI